ncbi:hypothetical protein RA2_03452 [Roseovarius sp. A-2]|nr:hypothetical protein RA2_03452 [Roseovarius sp. A-2]
MTLLDENRLFPTRKPAAFVADFCVCPDSAYARINEPATSAPLM